MRRMARLLTNLGWSEVRQINTTGRIPLNPSVNQRWVFFVSRRADNWRVYVARSR
jgi:hypothetical protein